MNWEETINERRKANRAASMAQRRRLERFYLSRVQAHYLNPDSVSPSEGEFHATPKSPSWSRLRNRWRSVWHLWLHGEGMVCGKGSNSHSNGEDLLTPPDGARLCGVCERMLPGLLE